MTNEQLKMKKEVFEKELDKLIEDFTKKRKIYHKNYIKLCWAIAIINAGLSFSVGISFIEEVALQFRVITLLLSSVLLIFNGAMGFLNYKNLYEQRTKTLINLHLLKREYKFMVQYSDLESDLNNLYIKLQNLMQDDLNLWFENIHEEREDEVKQC